MKTEMNETPRYRVAGDNWVAINGLAHPPGALFETRGWPPNSGANIDALNEPAKRILDFLQANRYDAFKPEQPYNQDHGRFYLPGVSADTRSTAIAIVPEVKALPNMPRYVALRDLADEPLEGFPRFPHRTLSEGEVVAIISWPRFMRYEFKAANDVAEKVWAYFEANHANAKLLPSPWDSYHREVFLPELPGMRRANAEAA